MFFNNGTCVTKYLVRSSDEKGVYFVVNNEYIFISDCFRDADNLGYDGYDYYRIYKISENSAKLEFVNFALSKKDDSSGNYYLYSLAEGLDNSKTYSPEELVKEKRCIKPSIPESLESQYKSMLERTSFEKETDSKNSELYQNAWESSYLSGEADESNEIVTFSNDGYCYVYHDKESIYSDFNVFEFSISDDKITITDKGAVVAELDIDRESTDTMVLYDRTNNIAYTHI